MQQVGRASACGRLQPARPLLFLICLAAPAATLETIAETVDQHVQPDRAMRIMRGVWERDRWFTFPKIRETADWLAGEMRRAGLRDVEVVAPPADGRTQYGFWTMPLAWDAKRARLEIVAPERHTLADFETVPASLGMWSGPTPPGGIEAEVVHIADGRPETIAAAGVKGKFVLTDQNPGGMKWLLVKHGATGAINAFTENPALADGRQWINAWGDKGWGMVAGDTPMPVFSITPRQTKLLKDLLARGPVKVRAVAETRLYRGEYPYVTARIRGTGDEEVLTLGHTAEQGAHDNATGVAAMLEALRTLDELIARGALPRPRRSIRMLAMPELYGTMHYLAANPARVKQTVAAMTLDTPAAPYEMSGTEYTFYMNPHAGAAYTDALVLEAARLTLGRRGRPFHWKEFMPGTDSFLGEPMIGMPTVWPYSGTGVHTHHNSEDKPETVDARSLRDLASVTAAYLYAIANAGEHEAFRFAELTAAWWRGRIASEPDAARASYLRGRANAAIRSTLRLAPGIAPRLQSLLFEAEPMAALPGPVVTRKRMGSITLDDLPREQWGPWPSGAWGKAQQLALFWCDGQRSVPEVVRLVELEMGPARFDFDGYFRFLAARGYVALQSKALQSK